jgi:hypothetical protein
MTSMGSDRGVDQLPLTMTHFPPLPLTRSSSILDITTSRMHITLPRGYSLPCCTADSAEKRAPLTMGDVDYDYGYGDAAPDSTDYGYGDSAPDSTDYGYGDASPDDAPPKPAESTDYGYGEASTDYGYGDDSANQPAEEEKEQGVRKHRSVRRNSCVVRKDQDPLAVAAFLMGPPPMSDRDMKANEQEQPAAVQPVTV